MRLLENPPLLTGSRERAALLSLLLLALALRLAGMGWGLPHVYHPDEPGVVDRALRIAETGDLNPHFFFYPSLQFYVLAGVLKIADLLVLGLGRWRPGSDLALQGFHYAVARCVTVLTGTATLLPVWLAGRRLWGTVTGLGGAAVLALAFVHVQNSQYATTDVPAALLTALCLWLAVRGAAAEQAAGGGSEDERGEPGRGWFVLSAVAAGLAAAVKYNAGLCVVTTVAFWLASRRRPREVLSWTPVLMALASLAVFLLCTPYILLDPTGISNGILHEWAHYHGGHHGHEGEHNALFYLLYLFREGLGPGLAALAFGGGVLLAVRERRRGAAFLVFPVLYFVLLASVRVRFERNLVPMLPWLALTAGYALAWIGGWTAAPARSRQMRVTVAVLLVLVAAVPPLWRAARYDWIITRTDTRTLAAAWIEKHLRAGASLCVENYAPPISEERYRVHSDWSLCARGLRDIAAGDCEFAVASSGMYGRYLKDPGRYPEMARCYEFVFKSWPLVREFRGREVGYHDPVVRVLYVPR